MACYDTQNRFYVLNYLARIHGHECGFELLESKTISDVECEFIEKNIIPIRNFHSYEDKIKESIEKIKLGFLKKSRMISVDISEVRNINERVSVIQKPKLSTKPMVVNREKVICKAYKQNGLPCTNKGIIACPDGKFVCKMHCKKSNK